MAYFLRLAALIAAATAGPLAANEPGVDWISIGRVEQILKSEGYRLIEIEPKDDHWEGEAIRHGKTWDFTMNPKTGGIITMEPDTD